MNRQARADKISDLCDERGCTDKQRKVHFDQYVKFGWDPHPPAAFMAWWNPIDRDEESGAHRGGHPDAYRLWARKDPDGWVYRGYGTTSAAAWNTQHYRDEFYAWQQAGSPERPEEFVSIAASLERQKQSWRDLKPIIDKIGKPMPIVSEGAIALEAGATRAMPDP